MILHTTGEIAGAAYFGKGLAKKAQGDIFGAVSAVSTASGYFATNEKAHQLCEDTLKNYTPRNPRRPLVVRIGSQNTRSPLPPLRRSLDCWSWTH